MSTYAEAVLYNFLGPFCLWQYFDPRLALHLSAKYSLKHVERWSKCLKNIQNTIGRIWFYCITLISFSSPLKNTLVLNQKNLEIENTNFLDNYSNGVNISISVSSGSPASLYDSPASQLNTGTHLNNF